MVAAGALLQGCAPMIAHGPQVQPGLSAGASLAVGGGPTYENGDDPGPFMFGALTANVAYGWRPADGRVPALRVGAHTSVLGGPGTDVYVQAPPNWLGAGAAGVGLHSDGLTRHMPYVQAGIASRDGLGVHAVVGRYAYRWETMAVTAHERAAVGWLSVQVPFGSHVTAHLHGGYARGHVVKRFNRPDELPDPYTDEDRWSQLGGVTLELHRARRR